MSIDLQKHPEIMSCLCVISILSFYFLKLLYLNMYGLSISECDYEYYEDIPSNCGWVELITPLCVVIIGWGTCSFINLLYKSRNESQSQTQDYTQTQIYTQKHTQPPTYSEILSP